MKKKVSKKPAHKKKAPPRRPSSAAPPPAKSFKDFARIGSRPGIMQIVPPRRAVRSAILHPRDRDFATSLLLPFAAPTGPGGAPGFHNVAGSQIAVPQVTNVYLGAFWGDRAFVEGFSKAIVENGYLDPLQQLNYGTGSGSYLGAVNGPTLAPGSTFLDSDAQSTLQKMLSQGALSANVNSLFVLILPDGVTSQASDGSQSCSSFCGYHDAFTYNGIPVAYAVLPSTLCQGCGGLIGDFTAVYAHELAESCTDKVPGQGWVAADGEENGDLEAWVLMGWGPPATPQLYTIQGYYTIERGNTVGAWRASS